MKLFTCKQVTYHINLQTRAQSVIPSGACLNVIHCKTVERGGHKHNYVQFIRRICTNVSSLCVLTSSRADAISGSSFSPLACHANAPRSTRDTQTTLKRIFPSSYDMIRVPCARAIYLYDRAREFRNFKRVHPRFCQCAWWHGGRCSQTSSLERPIL